MIFILVAGVWINAAQIVSLEDHAGGFMDRQGCRINLVYTGIYARGYSYIFDEGVTCKQLLKANGLVK